VEQGEWTFSFLYFFPKLDVGGGVVSRQGVEVWFEVMILVYLFGSSMLAPSMTRSMWKRDGIYMRLYEQEQTGVCTCAKYIMRKEKQVLVCIYANDGKQTGREKTLYEYEGQEISPPPPDADGVNEKER
jgi:hypothetical protein